MIGTCAVAYVYVKIRQRSFAPKDYCETCINSPTFFCFLLKISLLILFLTLVVLLSGLRNSMHASEKLQPDYTRKTRVIAQDLEGKEFM